MYLYIYADIYTYINCRHVYTLTSPLPRTGSGGEQAAPLAGQADAHGFGNPALANVRSCTINPDAFISPKYTLIHDDRS